MNMKHWFQHCDAQRKGKGRAAFGASRLTAMCTPDMGMNLWGGSPLWEFLECP